MFIKISHILLFVHDQEKALDFYKKVGFIVHTDAMFDTMRWLTLTLPGQKDLELILMKAETEQEKALAGKQGGDKPLITFESNDVQRDYENLKTMGVLDLEKPETQPWGISFSFKDVDGNSIYVCQPNQ